MLISPAYAQAAGAGGTDALAQFLPLILIFVVFWFLLIRPQQKRAKEHKAMLQAIRRGDRVVTNGGMIGKVIRVQDAELTIEVAENVRVQVLRDMVGNVLAKTDAAKADKANDDEPDAEEGEADSADAPAEATEGKASGLRGLLSKGKK